MRPSTSAYTGSMWLPNAPARRTRVEVAIAGVVHQQAHAGVQRGLGELDRAHVVLGDAQLAGRRRVQHVRERAAVGHDTRRARGGRAVDRPVAEDHAGEEQLGDHLDHARTANARDVDGAARVREAGLVRPGSMPMTLMRGSRVSRIDAHPFDRAGRRALAAADSCAPSNAGPVGLEAANSRSRLPSTISALVPTSTSSITSSPRCGPSCSTAAAVSAPTWPAMHGNTWRCAFGRPSSMSSAHASTGSSVARVNGAVPSGVGIDAEHEVMHDRVADEHDVDDPFAWDAGRRHELVRAPRAARRGSRR